ncbi:MAG: YbjN domain-containing protein [Flavobacteriia bacterium]|nr:YbjN domain-containing protein [Flavobacteriia bacterium]
MKTLNLYSFLLTIAFSLFGLVSSAQYTESELQEMYMDFLSDEGIEGFIDSDGDVQFDYNGRNYFIEVSEEDQEFFRVVLFNLWPIESTSEAVEVAFACDAVNRQMKVAKAYTLDDNVWIACELFVGSPRDFKSVWNRCLDAIERGVDVFVSEM